MAIEDESIIRELVPLTSLSDEKFQALMAKARAETHAESDVIFQQGDPENVYIYLLSGKVGFYIGELLVETIDFESTAARFALAHQIPRKVTAIALTEVRIVRIDAADLSQPNSDRPEKSKNTDSSDSAAPLENLVAETPPQPRIEPPGNALEIDEESSSVEPGSRLFERIKSTLFGEHSEKFEEDDAPPATTQVLPENKEPPRASSASQTINLRGEHQGKPISSEASNELDFTTSSGASADPLQSGITPDVAAPAGDQGTYSERKLDREENIEFGDPIIDKKEQLLAIHKKLHNHVPGITGLIVHGGPGLSLTGDFPDQDLLRVFAVVSACSDGNQINPDNTTQWRVDEFLLKGNEWQLLIYRINDQQLLAVRASSQTNLGLLRLECSIALEEIRSVLES